MQYSVGHKYELHISVHKYMLGFFQLDWCISYRSQNGILNYFQYVTQCFRLVFSESR